MCSGTVTDPQKEYNLEFVPPRPNLAQDFEALCGRARVCAPPHPPQRAVNLIYVKDSANVERPSAPLWGRQTRPEQMQGQKAVKQVRNQINRQTNCDTANLGKTARANAQT